MGDVERKLREVLMNEFHIPENEIFPQALLDNFGFDSLDTIELIMQMEEEYDIDVSLNEAKEIQTFGQLVASIEKKINV